MRKMVLICGLLAGVGSAQDVTVGPIKIANKVNQEVKLSKDAEFTKTFNLYMLQDANPLDVELEVVKGGYPGNNTLLAACKKHLLGILKAPATAKFPVVNKPTYYEKGGVYVVTGKVDSQNSYGALLRSSFWCTMAYSGNEKAGILYVMPEMP